jgi:hypothetical protein
LFVIINLELPSNFLQNIAPSSSRNDVVQAEEHDQENEDLMEEDDEKNQLNDPMEEDYGENQLNDPMEEDDGTNQRIQDLFLKPDEDGDNVGIYDEPLLEKANKQLYEGSRSSLLSATFLLVNLKVMNNLSNTCITHILRYVICFISYYT